INIIRRCCVILCAAALPCLAATALRAESAPATQAAKTAKTAPAKATPAPVKLTPAAVAKRPHRVVHRPRGERADRELALTDLSDKLNNNTVAIIAGGIQSTDLAVAHDLAVELADGDKLRIMPIVAAGGARNVRDVRFVKSVDLGIAP